MGYQQLWILDAALKDLGEKEVVVEIAKVA
jgi:hypothetical protein